MTRLLESNIRLDGEYDKPGLRHYFDNNLTVTFDDGSEVRMPFETWIKLSQKHGDSFHLTTKPQDIVREL